MGIAHSGLSGIVAATTDLSTTGNNIANAGTVGFKGSSVQFADVMAGDVGGGVSVSSMRQTFTQGSILGTGNDWDLAISGRGFFKVTDSGGAEGTVKNDFYTRNGAFGLDSKGYVQSGTGMRLHMYKPTVIGATTIFPVTTNTEEIRIKQDDTQAKTTAVLTGQFNLNAASAASGIATADATPPASVTTDIDPSSATTYDHAVTSAIYDSVGTKHTLNSYFRKDLQNADGTSLWSVFTQSLKDDGTTYPTTGTDSIYAGTVTFDANGVLSKIKTPATAGTTNTDATVYDLTATPQVVGSTSLTIDTGIGTVGISGTVTMNIDSTTQYSSDFRIVQIGQDGYASGSLTNIGIDEGGVITASYSNGSTSKIGKIAMFAFNSPNGLRQEGGVLWGKTNNSGDPRPGSAGESIFGRIKSQSLESSTVDVTQQLVNLITAQRNFQANAKMISAGQEMNQVVLNI
ncbi:MAG: flagellar hook protein FlgE [Thiotrichales bacterium]|jgi:flagellar hook protein FlgE|nr:flagellar hook protein FlgE [Thiotrichales bacterium]MBT3613510.1 flagellar hook protein FlgE [Thiotrichales bacterium]MBT3753021.1 flagellar hook protein FlgE [Thiotrichales bacterium]MBT3836836.1 flagellar hook protein FlgE [Thiotrichales bacterium]MBT4151672.1 flagellar hook protein FlgE [Thiotrichales bacterium]